MSSFFTTPFISRQKHFTLLLIAFFTVFTFTSCDEKADDESAKNEAISVITQKVSRSTLKSYIELNGGVEAQNSVKVYPNISGKVASTRVELGSSVQKGDVLLYVDPSSPGNEFALSRVTAPISGSIVSIPPRSGVRVSTETEIVTIGDLSKLQVRTYVPEKYFSQLFPRLEAEIRVESSPDNIFKAHISRVSPVVDEQSRTVEVIIVFDKKDKRITAGMFSKIRLYLKEHKDVIAIPESAIVERAGEKTVFLAEGGKARASKVAIGVSVDGKTEIISGINENETVITGGLSALQDGSLIKEIASDKDNTQETAEGK